jgi:hypothetical protein
VPALIADDFTAIRGRLDELRAEREAPPCPAAEAIEYISPLAAAPKQAWVELVLYANSQLVERRPTPPVDPSSGC